jgi:hypothetical protein
MERTQHNLSPSSPRRQQEVGIFGNPTDWQRSCCMQTTYGAALSRGERSECLLSRPNAHSLRRQVSRGNVAIPCLGEKPGSKQSRAIQKEPKFGSSTMAQGNRSSCPGFRHDPRTMPSRRQRASSVSWCVATVVPVSAVGWESLSRDVPNLTRAVSAASAAPHSRHLPFLPVPLCRSIPDISLFYLRFQVSAFGRSRANGANLLWNPSLLIAANNL